MHVVQMNMGVSVWLDWLYIFSRQHMESLSKMFFFFAVHLTGLVQFGGALFRSV